MSEPDDAPALVVDALGVPVGVRAPARAAARLRAQWSRALTHRPAATSVSVDRPDLDPDQDQVGHDYAVTTRVTMAALEATAGLRLNIHAGAVSDPSGRALAVVGASGAGKTTAVIALGRRLGYLSDETVSLDDGLRVHPHPKPLSVITDPAQPLAKASVSPDDLGLVVPPARAHLRRIVLLHRGDAEVGIRPVSPPRAIAAMVSQTSSLARLRHPLLRLAELVDACGGAWELHYRECERWLDELVGLLDREPREAPLRFHHPYEPDADDVPPGAWSRLPWADAVEYEEELVVMTDSEVRVLGGLGVVVWLALEVPRTTEDLVARARELYGEHPDAHRLVTTALEQLGDEGLVLRPG